MIIWKWVSLLTGPGGDGGDGESGLAQFHVIENLLANEVNIFPGCPM